MNISTLLTALPMPGLPATPGETATSTPSAADGATGGFEALLQLLTAAYTPSDVSAAESAHVDADSPPAPAESAHVDAASPLVPVAVPLWTAHLPVPTSISTQAGPAPTSGDAPVAATAASFETSAHHGSTGDTGADAGPDAGAEAHTQQQPPAHVTSSTPGAATPLGPVLPVSALTPALAPAPTLAPAPAPVTTPSVTHQVAAEVERLVTTGPQSRPTQHVTLKLAPEALGEVRVTLSMRGDSVHVRLAAGSEQARHALREGSPELRQLLEGHAADVRVTVRDAVAPGAAVPASAVTPTSAQLDLGHAPSHQAPSHQTSDGAHPDASRRDRGRQARTPAAPQPTRATDGTDQVTASRSRLDVTM